MQLTLTGVRVTRFEYTVLKIRISIRKEIWKLYRPGHRSHI